MLTKGEPVVVGSVVSRVDKIRLAPCIMAKPIGFRSGVPEFMCDLGYGVCLRSGHRAKFRFCLGGFQVVSVCERFDNFSVREK